MLPPPHHPPYPTPTSPTPPQDKSWPLPLADVMTVRVGLPQRDAPLRVGLLQRPPSASKGIVLEGGGTGSPRLLLHMEVEEPALQDALLRTLSVLACYARARGPAA